MATNRSSPTGEALDAELAALLDVETLRRPRPSSASSALLNDPAVYEQAAADPQAWWAAQAERARLVRALDDACSTTTTRRSTSGSPAAR